MSTPKHTDVIAELTAIINELPKYKPNSTFIVASKTYTLAEVLQIPAALLAVEQAVVTAKMSHNQALADRDLAWKQQGEVFKNLRQQLINMFKGAPSAMEALKLDEPKERTPLTVEQRLIKQAKASSTRVARGTKGPKAKSKIHGNVTGVAITPVTDPKK